MLTLAHVRETWAAHPQNWKGSSRLISSELSPSPRLGLLPSLLDARAISWETDTHLGRGDHSPRTMGNVGGARPGGQVGSYNRRRGERRTRSLFCQLTAPPFAPLLGLVWARLLALSSVVGMGPGKAWPARAIETWVETTGKGADSSPEFAEGTGGDHFVITMEKLCEARTWICKVESGLVSLNLQFQDLKWVGSLFFSWKNIIQCLLVPSELCDHLPISAWYSQCFTERLKNILPYSIISVTLNV